MDNLILIEKLVEARERFKEQKIKELREKIEWF